MGILFPDTEQSPSSSGVLFPAIPSVKPDLSTSAGLFTLAQDRGGTVARAAQEIVSPEKSFLGTIASIGKQTLQKTIRVLQMPSNIVAGAIDPELTIREAINQNIAPSDVLIGDLTPETKLGKVASFTGKLAIDVLTDPLTYVTFGAGSSLFGVRGAQKIGGKALTKTGSDFLKKGIEQGLRGGLSEDFVQKSFLSMTEKSPELAEKFFDAGGVKVFGKTILSGQRIRTAIEAIPLMKAVDRTTTPIRNAFGALFSQDIDTTFGKIPEEFVALRRTYTSLGRTKSKEALQQVLDIASANKLTWQEAELVTSAIETGSTMADSRLQHVANSFTNVLGRVRKEEQARGLLKSEIQNYVPHVLVDEPVKQIPFRPPQVRTTVPFAKHRTIEGVIENINADFESVFFDPNIVKSTAKRVLASSRATIAYDFFRDVASKFGAKIDEAPKNYIAASAKELEDFVFHPAIAKQLDRFQTSFISDEATNAALRVFDRVQNFWKASVTSIFPAFHGRNAISNVFLNYLDIGAQSLNPRTHALAGELIAKNATVDSLLRKTYTAGEVGETARQQLQKELSSEIFKDRYGHSYTFGELRQLIKVNGVAFTNDVFGLMDLDTTISRQLEQIALKPKERLARGVRTVLPISQEFAGFKLGRTIGTAVEEQARLVNFLSHLKKTGDPLHAATRTKQFLFDYQDLAPMEKAVLRRLIPFYTFTRKNLELQAKTLLTAPGRAAAEVRAVTTLGELFFGQGKISDEERASLPDWIKQGIGFVADRKGETVTIFSSLQTPFEQPFTALQPRALLSSFSPFLRVPIEQAAGYEFFRGKPLSDVDNAAAFQPIINSGLPGAEALRQFLGYQEIRGNRKDGTPFVRYVSLHPERMHLLTNLPPTSRVLSALRQATSTDVDQGYRILQQLVGIRPFAFDLDFETRKRENERRKQLEDLLTKAGITYRFQRTFIPKNP